MKFKIVNIHGETDTFPVIPALIMSVHRLPLSTLGCFSVVYKATIQTFFT